MVGRRPVVKHSAQVGRKIAETERDQRPGSERQSSTTATARRAMVIEAEVDIEGSVYIDASVRLEGSVDGEIRCTELEISKQAKVRGRIVAERVTVYGTVLDGSIFADVLILKPGCSVEAEIFHEHLQLDQGSYFDGKSRRVANPTGLAPS